MEAVRTSETSVDNQFTRQYNPEDSSEHHTRRRENLKSHMVTEVNHVIYQDSRSPDRDLNPGHDEQEAGVTATRMWRSIDVQCCLSLPRRTQIIRSSSSKTTSLCQSGNSAQGA
jgi:hypothetical protein